ncbi:MAG: hypothetical protein V1907_01530 [Candidatus Kerfeldbacteria bacterium]
MDTWNIVLFVLAAVAGAITVTLSFGSMYPFPSVGWFTLAIALTCVFRGVLVWCELMWQGVQMMFRTNKKP